jgi:hypothetical protein
MDAIDLRESADTLQQLVDAGILWETDGGVEMSETMSIVKDTLQRTADFLVRFADLIE